MLEAKDAANFLANFHATNPETGKLLISHILSASGQRIPVEFQFHPCCVTAKLWAPSE